MIFYKHWMGDYQRDTGDLSLVEHGAFRLLLDHYYATEEPLPAEPARLYRIAKAVTPDEQEAVRVVADRFFPVVDGERRNARADAEMADAKGLSKTQSEKGKLGGRGHKKDTDAKPEESRPKAGTKPEESREKAERKPEESPEKASHSHSHSHSQNQSQKPEAEEAGAAAATLAELFAQEPHRSAYLAYRAAHRMPDGLDASLTAIATGMHGSAPVTWERIGSALVEMRGAAVTFSANALTGFLRKLGASNPLDPAYRGPLTHAEKQARYQAAGEKIDAEIAAGLRGDLF